MDQVILYGAGEIGTAGLQFLESQGLADHIHVFCDKDAADKRKILGKSVITYEEARQLHMPFVITVSRENKEVYEEIESVLKSDGCDYYEDIVDYMVQRLGHNRVEASRDYCAFFHLEHMDDYFTNAESKEALKIFWAPESEFFRLFQQLSLESVVELACGHGRHVTQYRDRAKEIMLVDVLEKNIEFVKKRFAGDTKIHFYKNSGYDLSDLPDEAYTALFTYDAMVHFEMMDVYGYLRETYRVLKRGGKALFHHSNYSADYKNSFLHCSNSRGRNFMSKNLFAYLAYRAGLEIIEQKVIDWDEPDLDCISLVCKP